MSGRVVRVVERGGGEREKTVPSMLYGEGEGTIGEGSGWERVVGEVVEIKGRESRYFNC